MKRRKRALWGLLPLALLLALPFPVASRLEERDAFCTGCHTVPEETYVGRAQATLAVEVQVPPDLSSAHYSRAEELFRCIDCHRGDQSFAHRWRTFLLGGRDALTFVFGRADPAIEKGEAGEPDLLNAGCASCHQETLLELGFNNHYHNQLGAAGELEALGLEPFEPPEGIPGTLFRELGETPGTLTCLDCHQAHITIPDADQTLYLDVGGVMFPACVRCHEETGKGPLELR